MTGPTPEHDIPSDFTSQISEKLKLQKPCESGSFGEIHRCIISTSEGTKEVAVKVFKIDPGRSEEKYQKAIHRELEVWLRLSKHPTIVPLLGIAYVESPLPALISQWMPSGTLHMYLEQGTITGSTKVELVMGVADGLKYLHSENVVHGDLHPANVLIDSSGNPRLIDFGLATIAGDVELQWNTTTAARDFNPRWRAPEVLGIHSDNGDPVRPNFESDMHSFGSVAFFIISEVIPWKEKKNTPQIIAELGKRATPARPDNILDDHWNLIQKCWSWDPEGRPKAAEVITYIPTKLTTIFGKTEMVESTIRTTPLEMAESTIRTTPPEMSESTISTILPELAESMSDTTGSQLQVVENHSLSKSVGQTLQLSNIQSVTPKMASETEHDTTSSSDTTGLERPLNRSTPRSHRTVVVVGETGAGRSSLVNLMAGEEVASASPDAVRCAMHCQEYTTSFGGDSYKVFDTVGLEEPRLGINEYLEIVENAYRLIKALDRAGGIDLLLFCIRAGRVPDALQSNYRLFHEFLCEKKVPIVLVITNLEEEQRMEDWWERNKMTFARYQIQVDHKCVIAANRKDLYEESRITILNLVQQFTADGQKQAWTGVDSLFKSLIIKLKELLTGNLRVKRTHITTHLTKHCGISEEVAQQLVNVDMVKQTPSNS